MDVGTDEMGRVVQLRGVAPRDRADQILEDMFNGWRHQQLARNLSFTTIDSRSRIVARFINHCNEMPWAWTVAHVDEFFGDLRAEHDLSRSTIRAYQNGLRLFCDYLTDPRYGWDAVCEQAFGSHPSQVVHEWNSAGHHQDNEQDPRKRAFTREELQAFFDRADDEVSRIRDLGRKGWLPASETRFCSRSPTVGVCAAMRCGTCRLWTSPGIRTPVSLAASDSSRSATAKLIRAQLRSDAAC